MQIVLNQKRNPPWNQAPQIGELFLWRTPNKKRERRGGLGLAFTVYDGTKDTKA